MFPELGRSLLERCKTEGIPVLLADGWAVGHYGHQRFTRDLDWVCSRSYETKVKQLMNSTPDHRHVITSPASIEKGLHVSCEKPLTRCLTEGRVMADAVKRKGFVFRTDSECRSHGYMTKTADLALNGYLGYKGPIGLQCYGIKQPAKHHLTKSTQAWKKITVTR